MSGGCSSHPHGRTPVLPAFGQGVAYPGEMDGNAGMPGPLPRTSGSTVAIAVFGWVVEIALALPFFTGQLYAPTYPLALAAILVGCLTASAAFILAEPRTGGPSRMAGLVVSAIWAWMAVSCAVIVVLAVDLGPDAFQAIWGGDPPPSQPTPVGFPSPTRLLAIGIAIGILFGFLLSCGAGVSCLLQLPAAIWRAARASGFNAVGRAAGVGVVAAVAALMVASLAWINPGRIRRALDCASAL